MQAESVPESSPVEGRLAALEAALPRRGHVMIFAHDYPDPDALASAAALHLLLAERFKRHSRILFTGQAARAENRELMRHFRYRWTLTEHARLPRRRMAPAVFVDAQPGSGNITLPCSVRPVAVFDHHPMPAQHSAEGVCLDVRPALGATASMMYEYLAAAGIAVPPWLATCLCYAILTETGEFTRGFMPLDRLAYLALLERANLRMLGSIRNAPLPQRYFAKVQEGIGRAKVFGHVAWSHIPDVPHPEIVPEVADRLARLERITWSFCTGVNEGHLLVSLRSSRRDARCGAILRSVLRGEGSAGGHDRMAAGSLSVEGLNPAQQWDRGEEIALRLLRRLDRRHAEREDAADIQARRLTDPPPGP